MVYLTEWYEVDPEKKTEEWADKVITYLRMRMQFLISPSRASWNMKVLMGSHDVKFTEDMFPNPQRSGVYFMPLTVMEKLRNILSSEIEDAGIQVQLKALDPTATDQKKKDRELLANRKRIEALISTLNAQIGQPPYSLQNEKDEDGKPLFGGDMSMFDDMGFDDREDEDIKHFFDQHYRLRTEIMAESPINFFMKFNQVEENFGLWVNDILAKKALAAKVFVNEINGAVSIRYVAPETIRTLSGNRRDYQDSPAREYIQNIFVHEFVQMVGDSFDWEKDIDYLLRAVNYANGQQFTGVHTDGYFLCGNGVKGDMGRAIAFADLLNFKVQVGYIEFKTDDKIVHKGTKQNKYGNPRMIKKKANYKGGSESGYEIYSRTDEVTRKATYLSLSNTSQKLYNYGKLSYQRRKGGQETGMEDEYSNFSIILYKEVGKTATEVAWPYIRIIERSFKQFERTLIKAKPPGMNYNWESLVKIAQRIMPDNNVKNSIEHVMEMFEKSADSIYTLPEIDGKPMGGGTQVNTPLPNGISASATQFLEVINYCFNEINAQLGISPLRNAYTPRERDTASLQVAAQQSSEKATGYIPRMLMKVLNHTAVRTLLFVQDIVKYRELNKVAYEFLRRAIGDQSVENIAALDNIPLHRFGIFVISLNVYQQRQKVEMMLEMALQSNQITVEQYLLISSIDDPQKAAMVLAYEKRRNERKTEQAMQQRAQEAQQLVAQQSQMEMQRTQMEGQMKLQEVQLKGEYDIRIEQMRIEGELMKQGMKIDAEPQKINAKTDAKIDEMVAKSDIEMQQPMNQS